MPILQITDPNNFRGGKADMYRLLIAIQLDECVKGGMPPAMYDEKPTLEDDKG